MFTLYIGGDLLTGYHQNLGVPIKMRKTNIKSRKTKKKIHNMPQELQQEVPPLSMLSLTLT
jgi:hypothetical protein